MARLSTGLRNAMAGNWGLGIMMNGGVIRVYGGTIPLTPDNPPSGPQLGRITTEGRVFIPVDDPNDAGLYLITVSPGALMADPEKGVWRLVGTANGTATWWRWSWAFEDSNAQSDYYPRVDGRVGENGLVLSSNAITTDTNRQVESFLFALGMGV